jgi:hypothetical protein
MVRRIFNRLAQAALASVVVLVFALPAAAQGMITGKVVDAKGEPVIDAKITIEQTDGVTRKFETKSDKKGEFIKIGLQSASFKVTAVSKDGKDTGVANTRVSQRGPSAVRIVIGAGAAAGIRPSPPRPPSSEDVRRRRRAQPRGQMRRVGRVVQQGARDQPELPGLLL